jgi:hypothetical protein
MKTRLLFLLIGLTFLLSSCTKEDIGPKLRREAEEKILGKWNVEKIVQQEYQPIPTLMKTDEYTGNSEDFYFFKSPELVAISTNSAPQSDNYFNVVNPTQMWIGDKVWRITELSDRKMTLNLDRYDVDNDKRSVTNIYLTR